MYRTIWLAFAVLIAPPSGDRLPFAALADVARDVASNSLTVVSESGNSLVLTDTAWKKLPRRTVKAKDHSGSLATYEGVILAMVLHEAGVTLGKELRGPRLANCLLVEAADGYRVAFSLAEIDPDMCDGIPLLADRKDGKALDVKEGPYRLVVPRDKQYSRWVRQVIRLSVQRPAGLAERPKDK
jgi:hypothetical protein